MSVVLSKESKISISPVKRVTEKYNPKITTEKSKRNPSVINCHVGNSGLEITILNSGDETNFSFHYNPNVLNDQQKDTRAKKAIIFESALLSFRNWLNNPANEKEYGFKHNKFSKLSNFTNEKMANFINKLFSENNHPEMVNIDKDGLGIYVEIDLKNFCKLPKTDKLIQYLERIDKRGKSITLTYYKTIY